MAWVLGNRQLYLVPQFFANKPVEHLLGPRFTAEKLNDDRWGHTLDWLDVHDLTKLFAGVATHALQIFGIDSEQVHVDTTSFSVGGEYAGYRREKMQRSSPSPSAMVGGIERQAGCEINGVVFAT